MILGKNKEFQSCGTKAGTVLRGVHGEQGLHINLAGLHRNQPGVHMGSCVSRSQECIWAIRGTSVKVKQRRSIVLTAVSQPQYQTPYPSCHLQAWTFGQLTWPLSSRCLQLGRNDMFTLWRCVGGQDVNSSWPIVEPRQLESPHPLPLSWKCRLHLLGPLPEAATNQCLEISMCCWNPLNWVCDWTHLKLLCKLSDSGKWV